MGPPRGDPAALHGHTGEADAIGHLTEETGWLMDRWLISRLLCEAWGWGVGERGGSLRSTASQIPAVTSQT